MNLANHHGTIPLLNVEPADQANAGTQPTPATTQQPSAPATCVVPRPRRRWIRWVAASLILVALAGAGWYIWQHHGQTQPASHRTAFHWAGVRQALDRHDYAGARDLLSARLESRPLDAQVQFLLARACRGLKDYEAAGKFLRRAAELQWPVNEVRLELALQQAQSGNLSPVERPLFEHIQRQPADAPLVYEALAEGYVASQRYRELWQLATAWQHEQPTDWLPWLFRGHAVYLDGFAAKAVPEYEKALQLAPDPGPVQIWLAGADMDTGRYRQALELYQAHLVHQADDINALFGVANCQASLGHEAEERAALTSLLKQDPNHIGGLLLQGKLELDSGHPGPALHWLDRACQLAPATTDILHNRLRALRDLGRNEEAERCRLKIQELTHQFADIDALKKQLRRDPDSVSTRFRIAELYEHMGRADDAAQWYRSVLSLDPTHTGSRRALTAYEKKQSATPHDAKKATR